MVGWFKHWRPFFYYSTNACFFSFIDHRSLNKQSNTLGLMVAALSHKHWDLGSIPRSPPFSILFCFPGSYAACLPGVHHASTIKACHMAQETNLKVGMRGPSYISVNHAHVTMKSQPGQASMGQNCSNIPPKGPTNPPCLHFSLFFILSLIYFNYIICFI